MAAITLTLYNAYFYMQTLINEGEVLDVVLAADATTDVPFLLGDLLVVPVKSGLSGQTIACVAQGNVELPKTTGTAITAGAKVYWDNSTGKITTTSSGNKHVGYSSLAAASSATTIPVLLNLH